jgi:hypothetical protein
MQAAWVTDSQMLCRLPVGQAAATLVNATNAQVTAAVANLTSKPTSQCCAFYGNTYLAQVGALPCFTTCMVWHHPDSSPDWCCAWPQSCNCDPAVIQLAAQQGTSAIQVATREAPPFFAALLLHLHACLVWGLSNSGWWPERTLLLPSCRDACVEGSLQHPLLL